MMAEHTVVSRAWCLPIPDAVDDVTAAALPNPALSSWLPLVWRVQLKPGETVLILGATGVAGKLAIQIAKHLRSEEHTSELQSLAYLVCRLLLEKKKKCPSLHHARHHPSLTIVSERTAHPAVAPTL